MLLAEPLRIERSVLQPEISRQVDHGDAGLGEARADLHRGSVRQRQERDVDVFEDGGIELGVSEIRPQVRVDVGDVPARELPGRPDGRREAGMPFEQPKELGARVAGCAGDRSPIRHVPPPATA